MMYGHVPEVTFIPHRLHPYRARCGCGWQTRGDSYDAVWRRYSHHCEGITHD